MVLSSSDLACRVMGCAIKTGAVGCYAIGNLMAFERLAAFFCFVEKKCVEVNRKDLLPVEHLTMHPTRLKRTNLVVDQNKTEVERAVAVHPNQSVPHLEDP